MAISEGARLCDLSFYEHATAIFSYLTHGSVGVPPPIPKELASDVVRRVVYELAFGTWRCGARNLIFAFVQLLV